MPPRRARIDHQARPPGRSTRWTSRTHSVRCPASRCASTSSMTATSNDSRLERQRVPRRGERFDQRAFARGDVGRARDERLASRRSRTRVPSSPVLTASRAMRTGSLQPSTSRRSPSLMLAIETASDSPDDLKILKQLHRHRAWPLDRRTTDDIVPGCEKSAKNRAGQGKTRRSARRNGGRQHHDDRRRARRPPRPRQADRLADADGHRSPRQAHRRPLAAHQGFRSARVARRRGVWRLGHFRGQLLRGGEDRRRARAGLLEQIRPELEAIKPMSAVFDRRYVKRLDGPNVKKGKNKRDLADQLREDMRRFKQENSCDRLVMVWCGSTEVYLTESAAHASAGRVREGARGERREHPVEHDLRVCGDQGRHPVRERGAEPERRRPGVAGARRDRPDRRSPART